MRKVKQQIALVGGVDTLHSPHAIAPDKSVSTKNLFPTISGELTKRAGMAPWAVQPNVVPYLGSPTAYQLVSTALNVDALYACSDRQPFEFVSVVTSKDADATLWVWRSISSIITYAFSVGITRDRRPCIFEVGKDVIVLPGNDTCPGLIVLRKKATSNDWEWRRWDFNTYTSQLPVINGNGNIFPKLGCAYQGSAVYANLGSGFEKSLMFADAVYPTGMTVAGTDSITAPLAPEVISYYPLYGMVPSNFLTSQWFIDLAGGEGSTITGLAEIMLSSVGTPVQTALLVLTEYDAFICTGRPVASTDVASANKLGTFVSNKVNYRVGCAAHATIQRTPSGVIWASKDEVWLLTVGSSPVPIGTYLRTRLRELPLEATYLWHAVYEDVGVYRLIVVTNMSVDADGNPTPIYEEWWLDLRDGMPRHAGEAVWYGPMVYVGTGLTVGGIGIRGMTVATRKNNRKQSVVTAIKTLNYGTGLAFQTTTVAADVSVESPNTTPWDVARPLVVAAVWQPESVYIVGDIVVPRFPNGRRYMCIVAGTSAVSASEPTWPTVTGGVTGDGTVTWIEATLYAVGMESITDVNAVMMEHVTGEHGFGAPQSTKTFQSLAVGGFVDRTTQLNVDVIQDGGARTETADSEFTNTGTQTGDLFGVLSEEFQDYKLRPDDGSRVVAKRIQFKLYDDGKYVVDDSNNVLYIGVCTGNDTATVTSGVAVSLTNGVYATKSDLLTMVQTALNSVWPGFVSGGGGTWALTSNPIRMALTGWTGTAVSPIVTARTTMTVNGAVLTDAQVAVAHKCMALLGLDEWPSVSDSPNIWVDPFADTVDIYGYNPTPTTNVGNWKFSEMIAEVAVADREPLNKKRTT